MRQAKTLMIGTMLGTLLAWAAPGVLAQAAPSGQASEPQTQAKAPAKNPAKPATPQPAKGTGTTAQSAAAKGPAKGAAQSAQKTSASPQPAKNGAAATKAQGNTASKVPAKSATQEAKKPAVPSTPSTVKAEAKKKTQQKPKKASAKPAKPSAPAGGQKEEPKVARRDPFESLVGRDRGGDTGPRLPGKAGLVISQLRLDGVVRYVDGMIAVVTNPQSRTYFLREGDQLYDGRVAKINMDGITFHEVGKDAFGKPVDREVSKRMYPSSGETQ